MCGFTILYPATENHHNLILSLAREINFSRVSPPPQKKIPAGATVRIVLQLLQFYMSNNRP